MTRKSKLRLMASAATVGYGLAASISGAQAQSVFDGYYGGISAGYYHFNADSFKDDFVACCSAGTHSGGSPDASGYNVGVLGGYGQTFSDRYYLGGELDASFSVANTQTFGINGCGSPEGIAKVKAKDSYGASARLGYLFTPIILGYVRGGFQATRFSAQYTEIECDSPNLGEHAKFAYGGRVGAGADINIGTWDWVNAPIFLRLEYAHTFYGSLNISEHSGGAACCLVGNPTEGHTLRFDPSDDIVHAAFIVKFGTPAPLPPPVAAAPPPPPPAAAPPAPPKQFVVYFEFDKSDLTPEGAKVVQDAAAAYKQTGSARIAVTGYTDLSGTQRYNLGLSKRRADRVHAALVQDGVPDGVIAEAWRGKENPAVPTADGVREPRNRRVEIVE